MGKHRRSDVDPEPKTVPTPIKGRREPGATLPTRPLPMAGGLSANGEKILKELEEKR